MIILEVKRELKIDLWGYDKRQKNVMSKMVLWVTFLIILVSENMINYFLFNLVISCNCHDHQQDLNELSLERWREFLTMCKESKAPTIRNTTTFEMLYWMAFWLL